MGLQPDPIELINTLQDKLTEAEASVERWKGKVILRSEQMEAMDKEIERLNKDAFQIKFRVEADQQEQRREMHDELKALTVENIKLKNSRRELREALMYMHLDHSDVIKPAEALKRDSERFGDEV